MLLIVLEPKVLLSPKGVASIKLLVLELLEDDIVKTPTSTFELLKIVSTVKELNVSSLKLPPTAASQVALSVKVVKLRALAGADILKTVASTAILASENSSKFKVS